MRRSQESSVGLQTEQSVQIQTNQTNGHHEPLVTIVIPTFNHGRYLAEAIQSVLNQTYGNIEIIVVDDGSTDNTKDVASQFGEQIEYIWQHNRGLCAARNSGIDAANGTYIGLLDADDMLEPDYCSWLVSALLAFPDAEGIICGYRFVDENNQPLPQVESRCIPSKRLRTVLLDGNFLVPESILVHRRCYENVGPFDLSLTACEDWDMWLRITESHRIISTERILTRHRVLSGSMSTDPERMLANRLAVLKKHVGDEPAGNDDGALFLRCTYGHAYFTSALEFEQAGDRANATKYLHKAATIYPEILVKVETFYEIGCIGQAKGSRGYLASLDIEQSSESIHTVLDQLVIQPNELNLLPHSRREVCAVAYWVLSMLAYGSGNSPQARRYLLNVLRYSPTSLMNREFLGLAARAILGEVGMSKVKRLGRRQALKPRSDSRTARV